MGISCPECKHPMPGHYQGCSYEPPHPDGFGGTDKESHLMSSRQGMKSLGYGMNDTDAERIRERAALTTEEAGALRERMRERYPKVAETVDGLRPPKQVLVVRTDLQMRKGKMVSQGAHASGKVFFDTIPRDALELQFPEGFERIRLTLEVDRSMFLWLAGIFTKVVCRADSEEELLEIYEKAKEAGLPCALIEDKGLTEFGGVPTKTCCAIGPASPDEVDPVTGHLKLL